ncbi:F-box domain-containing protein [Pleurotus pulmonarius]
MPSFKTSVAKLALLVRRRSRKLALPSETWVHILSFLADSEILPLYGVNRLFYNVAMESQYRLLSFCDGKGFLLGNACLRDVELKKRIKSICISSSWLFVDEELGISNLPAQSPPVTPPVRNTLSSLLSHRNTPKVPEQKNKRRTPPEQILVHILSVLDGAENLKELRIIHDYGPRWDFSSQILHPVSATLSNHSSLRKLYVEGYWLDEVLPLVQFHNLTSVFIAISFSSQILHSMEAVPSFVKHVAPSVEVLHFSVTTRGHSGSISVPMAAILCANALTMPNLRELTTPLMVSPDPTLIFHTISAKYGSLTKLDIYINAGDFLMDVPLSCLALPHLRILYLSFAEDAPIVDLWDGQWGFTELNEFRIKGRYLRLQEVDSMCRFFAKTALISLSIRVLILDGPLLRVLENSLPALRDLDLFANYLVWARTSLTEKKMSQDITHFAVDVQGRGLQGWGLERLFVSFYIGGVIWSRDPELSPPHQVASILSRCIPSIRTTACNYHGDESPHVVLF